MPECDVITTDPTHHHLAILRKPYLDLIVMGLKRLEFRLTRVCQPPFGRAAPGETVYLKQSSGPYRARAVIEATLFVQLGPHWPLDRLREQFQPQIQASDQFWEEKAGARYASLIWLTDVEAIGRDEVPADILGLSKAQSAWRVVPVSSLAHLK